MLGKKKVMLRDLLKKWAKWSKKDWRKDKKRKQIQGNKWTKKLVRRYQSENEGVNPLPFIPNNSFYCYDSNGSCPFYYMIEIPEAELDNHVGIVAMGQTHIGGCKLLKKTDNDFGGWGLLWDSCKECHLKGEQ